MAVDSSAAGLAVPSGYFQPLCKIYKTKQQYSIDLCRVKELFLDEITTLHSFSGNQ